MEADKYMTAEEIADKLPPDIWSWIFLNPAVLSSIAALIMTFFAYKAYRHSQVVGTLPVRVEIADILGTLKLQIYAFVDRKVDGLSSEIISKTFIRGYFVFPRKSPPRTKLQKLQNEFLDYGKILEVSMSNTKSVEEYQQMIKGKEAPLLKCLDELESITHDYFEQL